MSLTISWELLGLIVIAAIVIASLRLMRHMIDSAERTSRATDEAIRAMNADVLASAERMKLIEWLSAADAMYQFAQRDRDLIRL